MGRPKGLREPVINMPCPHCQRVIRTRAGMTRHVSIEHPSQIPLGKECSSCHVVKPLHEFPVRAGARPNRNGVVPRRAECHHCRSARDRRNVPAADRTPAQRRDRQKVSRQRYGLTLAEYDAFVERCLAECEWRCPGCLRDLRVVTYHFDHDHRTMLPRGVLCRDCNIALGLAGDDPDTLLRLVSYLVDTAQQDL